MKVTSWKFLWTLIGFLGVWPVLLFGQLSGSAQNLANCKQGREICHRSRLTEAQLAEVARADRLRNVSDCRSGYKSCDRLKLSAQEATALAVADHQRIVSACESGIDSCDELQLTRLEARDVADADSAA